MICLGVGSNKAKGLIGRFCLRKFAGFSQRLFGCRRSDLVGVSPIQESIEPKDGKDLDTLASQPSDLASQAPNTDKSHSFTAAHSTDQQALGSLLAADKQPTDPKLFLAFNCKVCNFRSQKLVSKLSFERGTVMIKCAQCNNLHLLADHLNWHGEGKQNLQQILSKERE